MKRLLSSQKALKLVQHQSKPAQPRMRPRLPDHRGLLVNGAVLALALVALVLAYVPDSTSARYLPTRADESDVEILKEIIRGIIEEANMEQLEARAVHKSGLPTRYLQAAPSALYKLERRSLETPQLSPGDGSLLHQVGSASRPFA